MTVTGAPGQEARRARIDACRRKLHIAARRAAAGEIGDGQFQHLITSLETRYGDGEYTEARALFDEDTRR